MLLSKETKDALRSALLKMGIELPAKEVNSVIKLEDVTLTDGTILNVDSQTVGSNATFTNTDGTVVPADGEYELPDGSSIVCKAGVITAINAPGSDIQPELMSAINELKTRLASIETKFSVIQEKNTTLGTELSETKKSLSIALSAIDVIDTNSVALSLEKHTVVKKELKSISEMNNYEKTQHNRGIEIYK